VSFRVAKFLRSAVILVRPGPSMGNNMVLGAWTRRKNEAGQQAHPAGKMERQKNERPAENFGSNIPHVAQAQDRAMPRIREKKKRASPASWSCEKSASRSRVWGKTAHRNSLNCGNPPQILFPNENRTRGRARSRNRHSKRVTASAVCYGWMRSYKEGFHGDLAPKLVW
jgi:hypothetical protein